LQLRTAFLRVYEESLQMNVSLSRVRAPAPAAVPTISQKLELQMRLGAYLFPSKFLLSRIRGDCACPVRDREATRVRL